jgi:ectoine hydroxylase-related dioxygenase (phytanoyl-CoA dioxygenase family)
MLQQADQNLLEPTTLELGPNSRSQSLEMSVPAALRQAWNEEGFVVIEGALPPHEIDAYNDTVRAVRKAYPNGRDDHGFGDRIGQLHQKHPSLLSAMNRDAILSFLRWAFGEDPTVFASLNFERGTQQEAHIDAIFFWPEPAYAMAGVWVALEDIHPDAGPLFYISGSHKWPFLQSHDVVASRPALAARREAARRGTGDPATQGALIHDLGQAWTSDFLDLEKRKGGVRVPRIIRKGDAVVWHSLLAHGGSPRLNPALSRVSAVFHFFGETAGLFTNEQFFLYSQAEMRSLQPQKPPVEHFAGGLKYMRFPYFVTYDAGQELVHPLS